MMVTWEVRSLRAHFLGDVMFLSRCDEELANVPSRFRHSWCTRPRHSLFLHCSSSQKSSVCSFLFIAMVPTKGDRVVAGRKVPPFRGSFQLRMKSFWAWHVGRPFSTASKRIWPCHGAPKYRPRYAFSVVFLLACCSLSRYPISYCFCMCSTNFSAPFALLILTCDGISRRNQPPSWQCPGARLRLPVCSSASLALPSGTPTTQTLGAGIIPRSSYVPRPRRSSGATWTYKASIGYPSPCCFCCFPLISLLCLRLFFAAIAYSSRYFLPFRFFKLTDAREEDHYHPSWPGITSLLVRRPSRAPPFLDTTRPGQPLAAAHLPHTSLHFLELYVFQRSRHSPRI